jgi:hypothetical protein
MLYSSAHKNPDPRRRAAMFDKLEHDRFKCDHAPAFLMRAIHVLAPRKMREAKTIAL